VGGNVDTGSVTFDRIANVNVGFLSLKGAKATIAKAARITIITSKWAWRGDG